MTTLTVDVLNANGGTTTHSAEGNTVAAAAEALFTKLQSAAVMSEAAADALRAEARQLTTSVLF